MLRSECKPGVRVKVCDGSGCDSRREGVIVPRSRVPLNSRGVPDLPGEGNYKPMADDEVAVMDDDGKLFTMFVSRLIQVRRRQWAQ